MTAHSSLAAMFMDHVQAPAALLDFGHHPHRLVLGPRAISVTYCEKRGDRRVYRAPAAGTWKVFLR